MGYTEDMIHDSDSPDPTVRTDARTRELRLTQCLKLKPPRLRNDALVDDSISTKKHAHTPANKHPQTILLESPEGSGATPAGALARTH